MIKAKQKFFDNLAADWHDRNSFNDTDRQKLKEIFSVVKFSREDYILDLGAGTGRLSEFLKRFYEIPFKIFISDISWKMVNKGQKVFDSLNFFWFQADSQCLPLKSEIFNHIICFSCFPHFENKGKVIVEARRLLKKNGDFLILHVCNRQEINQFHSRQSFPINKDLLPDKKQFQKWSEEMAFPLKDYKDGKGYFMARFVKE